MWRISNGAVRPGMLYDVVLKPSMVIPWLPLAFPHSTDSSECLTTQAAITGEGVQTLSILLEQA